MMPYVWYAELFLLAFKPLAIANTINQRARKSCFLSRVVSNVSYNSSSPVTLFASRMQSNRDKIVDCRLSTIKHSPFFDLFIFYCAV